MRVSTAFFVGAGTVVVAIAAGLGGGLLLGNIMSPQQPKHPSSEVTRLEQRAAPQPIPAMAGASQPVPYMAAPQIANTVSEQASQQPQQAAPQQAQPHVQEASTKSAESTKPERSAAVQPAAVQPPANTQPTAAPEDSYARARDADLKRRAEDRRKAERRQQWADKRKSRERQGDDLDSVEASVREATEARPVFSREQRYERREPSFFGRGGPNLFDD
jgi:hypothetical protein